METLAVNVTRKTDAAGLEADLLRARWLANLMDAEFELAGVKFGLDAIVGLLPGVGDVAAMAIGLYPLHLARKHGLSKGVQRRMIANLLIDGLVGAVPVVGDIFDIAFKANLKNLALLEKAIARRQE